LTEASPSSTPYGGFPVHRGFTRLIVQMTKTLRGFGCYGFINTFAQRETAEKEGGVVKEARNK